MDGNGRWARKQGRARLDGHRRGAEVARDVVEWAADAQVRQISLYAFSTENWDRPPEEVNGLMHLLASMLTVQIPRMCEQGVRLRVLGEISALPGMARSVIERAIRKTAGGKRIDLILCLNYGGQQEILAGIRNLFSAIRDGRVREEQMATLSPREFRNFLWRADLLPVDLLIRTGGEYRISNFHLWDAAYAELYFSPVYWPDYTREEFHRALESYAHRERRFGQTSEQLQGTPKNEAPT